MAASFFAVEFGHPHSFSATRTLVDLGPRGVFPIPSGIIVWLRRAVVAKLVDAPDLGSGAERHLGSSPSDGTILTYPSYSSFFFAGTMLMVPSISRTASLTSETWHNPCSRMVRMSSS